MEDSTEDPIDLQQIAHANEWFDQHGQMSFEHLKTLVKSGTPEALETLYQLADDNSIVYDQTTNPMDLAEKISLAIEADPNSGVE